MADNTLLNPGLAGDTIRTLDRSGSGPKTEVVQLDLGGPDPNVEKLITGGKQLRANSVPVVWPSDEPPLVVTLDQAVDDDGIPYVNPNVPGSDIATGDLQRSILSAVLGNALSPQPAGSVSVGVTSVPAVLANPSRKGLVLTNASTGGQRISLSLNGSAAVLDTGIVLYPANWWWMDRYSFVLSGITAIASAAGAVLSIQEFS